MRYTDLVTETYEEFKDLKWWTLPDGDYPIRDIAQSIGATHYANWGKIGAPWSNEMIGGSGSYILKGPWGYILSDAATMYERGRAVRVGLSQVSVSNPGSGVGTRYMELLKQYADSKELPITVYKVTNPAFFDRFDWLRKDSGLSYVYRGEKD